VFEKINLSRHIFGQLQVFVLIRLRGEIGGGRFHHLVRLSGENFRVVGYEGLLDPLRAASANPQVEEFRFGGLDEFARAFRRHTCMFF
jgi:hypothetical protein